MCNNNFCIQKCNIPRCGKVCKVNKNNPMDPGNVKCDHCVGYSKELNTLMFVEKRQQ